MVGVIEKLAGDAGDGNVVDVDVLLADEVKQKVEGTIVDLADGHGKRRLRGLFFVFVRSGAFRLWRWWRHRLRFKGERCFERRRI